MKVIFTSLILFLIWLHPSISFTQTPITIGNQVKIDSEILGQERTLNIYLPQTYHPDSSKHYPVIYLLDGSMHEDFIHIAGLTQFHSYPWLEHMPECIVVGIENINRYHDFTYASEKHEDLKVNIDNGGSPEFIQFIEKELQPYIKTHYKTDTLTTIVGQSLGGLLATEILFKNPDLFDNYLIVSPSLWWDESSLLEVAPKKYNSKKNIYIAVGKEGKVMEKAAKQLYKKIKKQKASNTEVTFRFFKELDHGDALHLVAYYGLDWLFE